MTTDELKRMSPVERNNALCHLDKSQLLDMIDLLDLRKPTSRMPKRIEAALRIIEIFAEVKRKYLHNAVETLCMDEQETAAYWHAIQEVRAYFGDLIDAGAVDEAAMKQAEERNK